MDGDPYVEPELDSFSLIFPLPYRVAFLIVLGIWAWGANLHYLALLKIDVPTLIRYPPRASPTQPAHHLSTYRLATILTITFGISIVFFWSITGAVPSRVIAFNWLPLSYLVFLSVLFVIPLQNLSKEGRYRFLAIIRRISIGGIAQTQDGKFGDILLADVLTSYAKVLADLFISLCMFFSSGRAATTKPDRNCGGQFLVPLIIAIPYLIRFRQCIIEYLRVQRANERNDGIVGKAGWGGQHVANAIKYASAFPVIILSALQRSLSYNHESVGLGETTVYRLWFCAMLINSFYSFYWDVLKDWDLTLLSSARERSSPDHAYGLRRRLHFRYKEVYYVVIVMDLILRCTWSLKLSSHLDHFNELEGGIFVMEVLEVFRRWIWIFFRVETEWVRHIGLAGSGPQQDDVLLSDWDGKDGGDGLIN